MKRFIPILLGLLALTACPQAGQLLGPSNSNVTASKEGGGDSYSATTPPEATTPTAPTDGEAAPNPIEPKSDPATIQGGDETALVRLRYGKTFETVLSSETETPDKVPLSANGDIHLPATAEMRDSVDSPWRDSEGSAVRMVYRPHDATAKPQYCDANVLVDYSIEEGGNVLFSGVAAGLGSLEFYHLVPLNADQHRAFSALNHDSVTPCASGWQPLDSETSLKGDWIYLGSLSVPPQFRTATTPQLQPSPAPVLVPAKP